MINDRYKEIRDTIRALLGERDALEAEIEGLREQLRLSTVDQVNAEAEANDARAEIEGLRAEVAKWKTRAWSQWCRTERLAEAIKAYKSECDNPARGYVLRVKRRDEMFALLRELEEGKCWT